MTYNVSSGTLSLYTTLLILRSQFARRILEKCNYVATRLLAFVVYMCTSDHFSLKNIRVIDFVAW